MKPIFEQLKRSTLIEQLAKHNYYDVEGKTDYDLTMKLSEFRALKINIECDANKYF